MKVLNQAVGQNFAVYHGDCCEVIQGLPNESVEE